MLDSAEAVHSLIQVAEAAIRHGTADTSSREGVTNQMMRREITLDSIQEI
jgi:hypothetical protein